MAIQTAYQAYNELHPECKPEEKHGIIHDFKASLKEVVHQIKGDDKKDKNHLVEHEVMPNPVTPNPHEDDELPEFSKTGYINHGMTTFTPQLDANNQNVKDFLSQFSESLQPAQFAESLRSINQSRRPSKHDKLILDATNEAASEFAESLRAMNRARRHSKPDHQHIIHENSNDASQLDDSIRPISRSRIHSKPDYDVILEDSNDASQFAESIRSINKSRKQSKHDQKIILDASNDASPFSESIKSINKLRRHSKNEREIILDAGDDIIQIKVVPKNPFAASANGKLVDVGEHVEVLCKPPVKSHNSN